MIQLNTIKPNPSNPRTIDDKSFAKLCESLRTFPQMMRLRPMVIDEEGIVLGGNMRLKALIHLGYVEVPDDWVVHTDELTEEQKKEFLIKDNSNFGSWEWDTLANEWDVVKLADWGVEVPTINPETSDDDYVPSGDIATSIQPGDLIEIGQHRLVCGSCLEVETLSLLMNGKLADLISTDPPYNVDYGANKNPPSHRIRTISGDKQTPEQWESFCRTLYTRFRQFSRGGDIYLWGAPGPEGMKARLWLVESGYHWSATIIWKKDQLVLSPAKYQRLYEPCFYGWLEKSTFVADRKQTEVWEFDRPKASKEHPTMKPVDLIGQTIKNSSMPGDIVLDTFLGSGTTMVAAEQLGRICYGTEIMPQYCQVIINRMLASWPTMIVRVNGKPYEPSTN